MESTLKLNVQLQTSPARPCLLVFAFANSYLALADDPHHTRTLSQIIKKEDDAQWVPPKRTLPGAGYDDGSRGLRRGGRKGSWKMAWRLR